MFNSKNPTALLLRRMQEASKEKGGVLVRLMVKFFQDNFGAVTLPKRVADFIFYDQLAAVGATVLAFYDGAFSPDRSNFPGGTFVLPQSEHALITGVRLLEGANASPDETAWTYGVNDALAKNGTLDVLINGVVVLKSIPLTAFQPGGSANQGTNENVGTFFFMEPLVLLGQEDITVRVSFGNAPTTANYNLRVELMGIRFIGG